MLSVVAVVLFETWPAVERRVGLRVILYIWYWTEWCTPMGLRILLLWCLRVASGEAADVLWIMQSCTKQHLL